MHLKKLIEINSHNKIGKIGDPCCKVKNNKVKY